MRELWVNPEWTFKEVVNNLKALRDEYKGILASFSCYEIKDKVKFKRNLRNSFYALNFEEWKKDKIWNYMNDFEFLYVLKGIVNRMK